MPDAMGKLLRKQSSRSRDKNRQDKKKSLYLVAGLTLIERDWRRGVSMSSVASLLDPMRRRKAHVGQDVGLGGVHQGIELGDLGPELIGDPPPLLTGGLRIVLGECRGDEG